MLTEFPIRRKTRMLTLFKDQLKEKHGSRKSRIGMILTTKVHFEELVIAARREDILPETVHNARKIIPIISTKEKDQHIYTHKYSTYIHINTVVFLIPRYVYSINQAI